MLVKTLVKPWLTAGKESRNARLVETLGSEGERPNVRGSWWSWFLEAHDGRGTLPGRFPPVVGGDTGGYDRVIDELR